MLQWLTCRASDSRLREPGFESCPVLKPWAIFFTLHSSSSLSCINEYHAIDSGGYVYELPSHINCSIWLDASQRSWHSVWLNRSAREVKCKSTLSSPEDRILRYIRTHLYLLLFMVSFLILNTLLQKEKYPDHYNEVFKDKSLRKSEVTPIIEKCALLVEKAEGRQSMKTIIDNDIIENCKYR